MRKFRCLRILTEFFVYDVGKQHPQLKRLLVRCHFNRQSTVNKLKRTFWLLIVVAFVCWWCFYNKYSRCNQRHWVFFSTLEVGTAIADIDVKLTLPNGTHFARDSFSISFIHFIPPIRRKMLSNYVQLKRAIKFYSKHSTYFEFVRKTIFDYEIWIAINKWKKHPGVDIISILVIMIRNRCVLFASSFVWCPFQLHFRCIIRYGINERPML